MCKVYLFQEHYRCYKSYLLTMASSFLYLKPFSIYSSNLLVNSKNSRLILNSGTYWVRLYIPRRHRFLKVRGTDVDGSGNIAVSSVMTIFAISNNVIMIIRSFIAVNFRDCLQGTGCCLNN